MVKLPPHALKVQVVPVHVHDDKVQPIKPQEAQQAKPSPSPAKATRGALLNIGGGGREAEETL